MNPNDDLMLISSKGILIRTGLDQLRDIGRNTQGVKLIRLDGGDKLVAVARVAKEEENGAGECTQEPPVENATEIENAKDAETIEEADEKNENTDYDVKE